MPTHDAINPSPSTPSQEQTSTPTQETAALAANTVSAFQTDPESLPGSTSQAPTPLIDKATTPTTATGPPAPSDSSSSSPNGTDIAPTQASAALWDFNNPDSRVAFVTSFDVETPSAPAKT